MKPHLQLGKIRPITGFEHGTARSAGEHLTERYSSSKLLEGDFEPVRKKTVT